MKLEGEIRIETAIENVWQVFMDPAMLCQVTPGCEEVRRLDETHYEGVIAIKVQFMTIRARARGELLESREPEYLVADLVGEAMKMAGAFRARMTIHLQTVDNATVAQYTFDITMLGRLGSLGEPIVRRTAAKLATQFADSIAGLFTPT